VSHFDFACRFTVRVTKLAPIWKNIVYAAKMAGWMATMPWVSLQAPIEQLLQEPDALVQAKQLKEWQVRKKGELEMVALAVRWSTRH
jgi:hypothetical protein